MIFNKGGEKVLFGLGRITGQGISLFLVSFDFAVSIMFLFQIFLFGRGVGYREIFIL